jgi:pteridine reductase
VRELETQRAGSAMSVALDLLETAHIDQLPRHASQKFGALDILVNNASTFYPTAIGEITEAHWNDLIGSNLKAPLFLSQAAAPSLRVTRGLIVNILDIHGMRPLHRYLTYSVAKAGLAMLTRGLARELGPQVRVNGVAPGPVMWPEDPDADQAFQQRIIDRTVLKRAGSSEDVARAVLFFATQAPYITGQILAVDGGRSIGW